MQGTGCGVLEDGGRQAQHLTCTVLRLQDGAIAKIGDRLEEVEAGTIAHPGAGAVASGAAGVARPVAAGVLEEVVAKDELRLLLVVSCVSSGVGSESRPG